MGEVTEGDPIGDATTSPFLHLTTLESQAVDDIGRVVYDSWGERSQSKQPYSQKTGSRDAALQSYWFISGRLRGKVPLPLPGDLMAVCVSYAGRIYSSRVNAGTMKLSQGRFEGTVEVRDPLLPSMFEMSILNRYRKTTA